MDRFVEVHDNQNRPISEITCIKGDPQNGIWLGSGSLGLLRWREGSLFRIGAEAGLPISRINGIIDGNQWCFWLTSNRGVVRARRAELEMATKAGAPPLFCQLFDQSDGLPSV